MTLRADIEALIKQGRVDLAYFERCEAACKKQWVELQEAKMAAQRVKGRVKTKARVSEKIERAESELTAGAKTIAAARVSMTAALLELQAMLDKLPEGEL